MAAVVARSNTVTIAPSPSRPDVDDRIFQPSAFLCPSGGDLNASSLTGAPLKQMMPQFARPDLNEQRRRGQPKNPKLYKTELCRSWMDYGRCNYGDRLVPLLSFFGNLSGRFIRL